jgi:hypothetical protein
MSKGARWCVGVVSVATLAACSNYGSTGPVQQVNLGNPDSLSYVLLPGAPAQPSGVLLTWVAATDPNVSSYVIYGRADSTASWGVVAYTGQTTFFDAFPQPQYYVASEDNLGDISSGTATLAVDTTPPMGAPGHLTGVALDSGAKLSWSDSVRLANASIFSYYRVYSEAATVSGPDTTCASGAPSFALEGTTVSENFVVTGIANGTPVCYGATSVETLGQESALSAWIVVTPSSSGGSFDIRAHPGTTVVVHRARVRRTRGKK